MNQKIVNCHKCKHFHVTWDYSFPKGCRLFQIKSKDLPSKLIHKSTGSTCSYFEEK